MAEAGDCKVGRTDVDKQETLERLRKIVNSSMEE